MGYTDLRIQPEPADNVQQAIAAFGRGDAAVVQGPDFFQEQVLLLTPEVLRSRFSRKPVSTHARFDGQLFQPCREPLGGLLDRLATLDEAALAQMEDRERMPNYGVLNARRLVRGPLIQPGLKRYFGRVLSFLWVGLSPGGLHFDAFDNILLQLTGRKRVTIFPARHSDSISREHYLYLADMKDVHSLANRLVHPWLARTPYHEVVLEAGQGVLIPNGAYHAPRALTPDSLSLNTFFIPRRSVQVSSPWARREVGLPDWGINLLVSCSRLVYSLSGRALVRTGHYEIF